MDSIMKLRMIAIASLVAITFSSCSTVPVTGRRQLNLMSDTEVVKMTKVAFEQMKAQMPISRDPRMNDWLLNVGERISQQVFWDMPLAEWEFVVFENPDVNAFAMPGGKVGVHTGLFKEGIVNSEEELAAVVSHEIAHVTARHTHEKLSQAGVLQAGSTITSMATGGLGNMILNPSLSSNMASWDRAKESEADRIGIMYMARAGYNPNAAIKVMEKMADKYGTEATYRAQQDPNVSHPHPSERLDGLHAQLAEAMEAYEKAKEMQF